MDSLLEYYKSYYDKNGYTMSKSKDSSRVLFLIDFIKKYVPVGGKILDVGCGDMYLSTALPEYEWHGIDINLKVAKGNTVEQDLMVTPYPFKTESFDAVVCSEVLEHLWDLRVVHKEVYRLLKRKGKYFMSTPNYDHIDHFLTNFRPLLTDPDKPHTMEHIRHYNYLSHSKFLKDAKFRELDRTGADAHYSHFFCNARQILHEEYEMPLPIADQLLGRCFPDYSHTILIVSEAT